MSRFKKLSHAIWHCEYNIVWLSKYRFRLLQGKLKEEVELWLREQTRQMSCELQEVNVQAEHVHLIVQVLPKLSISEYMGRLKGKTAIGVFSVFRDMRLRRGNHFWTQGYCVDTAGLGGEMMRKYVKWLEKQEQRQEELRFSK